MENDDRGLRLSARLESVLGKDRIHLGRIGLTESERLAVQGLLSLGIAADEKYDLARVMEIAADNVPDESTAESIAIILRDSRAPARLRLQAIALLGEIGGANARRALAVAAKDATISVRAGALQALAKCGDPSSEQQTAAMPPAAGLTELQDRARASIALRHSLPLDESATAAVFPRYHEVGLRPEKPEAVAEVLLGLRGSKPAPEFSRRGGYSFECGGLRHLLLLNVDLSPSRLLENLRLKSQFVGLIVSEVEGGAGEFVARADIATRSNAGAVEVSVVTRSGLCTFTGSLRDSAGRLVLNLISIPRAAPPTIIEGTITEQGLVATARSFRGPTPRKRTGEGEIGD